MAYSDSEIAAWAAYRGDGEHTIEETALHFGVSLKSVQTHTPKGIKNDKRKGQHGHVANAADPRSGPPPPTARIVRPSVARRFR